MDIKMPIDIPCEELLDNHCTYCGWLRKEPVMKFLSWRKTYCVLHDRCFYYFKSESSKSPSGKFPLYGYNKVKRNPNESVKWSFILEHVQTTQKSYIFAASSQQEMVEWMKKFKEEMLRANNQGLRTTADGSSDESGAYYRPDTIERIEETVYDDLKIFKPVVYQNEDCDDSDLDQADSDVDLNTRLASLKCIDKLSNSNVTESVTPFPLQSRRSSDGQEYLPPRMLLKLPQRAPAEGQSSNSKRFSYEKVDIIGVPQVSRQATPQQTPEDDYWKSIYYYGDKDEASRKIEEIGKDGVYLVRDSDDVDAPKVLVAYSAREERAKKFKIFMTKVDSKCMYFMKKDLMFETVEEVIFHHYHNGISSNPDFKITEPYLRCKP